MTEADRRRAAYLGLCALQAYVEAARRAPVHGSIELRALLATLAMLGRGQKQPYIDFWTNCRRPIVPADHDTQQDYVRGTYAQTAWYGVARDLGFNAQSVAFCHQVQAVVRRHSADPHEVARRFMADGLKNAKQWREFKASKGARGQPGPGDPGHGTSIGPERSTDCGWL